MSKDSNTFDGQFVHAGRRYWVISLKTSYGVTYALSPAEFATALCVAKGYTNLEVARVRGVALRTVANQVASILRKTRATSRAEVGAKLFATAHTVGDGE